MADRIRSHQWQKTPLGDVCGWSETLTAAVNSMLSSPFASAIYWTSDLTLLYNDHYRQILGAKHPKSLGTEGAEVWAEAWNLIGEPIRAAYQNGVSTSARRQEIPILIDGQFQPRWWTYGLSPILENGLRVGVTNIVVEDTAAVISELELRRSREEFVTGMDAASLGMWRYDPKTGIVLADARMHRIFGSPKSNGVVDYWLDLLHPEDRHRVGEHFVGVLAGKHDYDIEYRIIRNDEVRWVRSKGKSVGPKEDPDHVYAIIEDITERKLGEAALQQSEKLAAVGRLAGSIAHEINNPLEAVTNLLYLVQRTDDPDQIHTYIDTAEQELRRVSLIANQTLRFHRQSTKATPEFCYDLIGDSLAIFQGRLVNNSIIVEKLKRAKHPVECLGGEIRQVLNNLIGNAIDAMPTGGRLLLRSREAVNYKTGSRELVITVADTGVGMTPKVRERLFEAFYTTKGNNGTGLGLWISTEIIRRHRGTLRFRTRTTQGKSGTVFNLTLPFGSRPLNKADQP